MRQALARTYKKTQGLAISTILLAVVLLAAIAVTIAMSSRASNGNASTQQAKLNASTLMNQASNMRIGYDRMQANGVDASTITVLEIWKHLPHSLTRLKLALPEQLWQLTCRKLAGNKRNGSLTTA